MLRWENRANYDVESEAVNYSTDEQQVKRKVDKSTVNDRTRNDFFKQLFILRETGCLCDVIFETTVAVSDNAEDDGPSSRGHASDTTNISAHKVVLAAGSSYFRAMFTSNMVETTKQLIVMNDMNGEALSSLIDYLYTGCIAIEDGNVQEILSAAGLLQLNKVKDDCASYMMDQIDASNCIGIAEFARVHDCAQLAASATRFIHKNFRDLLDSDELLSMNDDNFFNLISDDRIATKGEEFVYTVVMKWINYDLENRKDSLARMLSAIRFALLSKDFLFMNIQDDPLVKNSSGCKDVLLDAYRFLMTQDYTTDDDARSSWRRPRRPAPDSNFIILVGGQAPKAISNVDLFDPYSHRWKEMSPLPHRRCRAGVALLDNLIYAVGGFNGSSRVGIVEIYDPAKDSWRLGPAMDGRRSTLGLASTGGILVAVGGFDGYAGMSSAEMLDPRVGNWQSLPPMSTRRSSVGVVALNGDIYAVGGYDGHSRSCLNTVEIYDMRAAHWRGAPSLAEVRSGAGVTVAKGCVVVAGGHDGPLLRDSAEILIGDAWERLPNMSLKRRNASIIAENDIIFALGGDDGYTNLSTVEALDLNAEKDSYQWLTLHVELETARSYAGVALLPKV